MLNTQRISAVQDGSNVCADIVGFDFNNYDDRDIEEVRKYWLHYGVLRFKAANITDEQQVAFSRHFGEFVIHPKQLQEGGHPTHKEILVIANTIKDGKPSGAMGNSEATWHTDTWFYERPPAGAILRAVEVPAEGGDTYFLSTYRAYDILPERLRQNREIAAWQGEACQQGFPGMERYCPSAGAHSRGNRSQGALSWWNG
jgi:taurine dioxygenase